MDRDDLPWIRRAECHAFLADAPVLEDGHEQRFTRQHPFARAHQRTEKSAALLGAVAEDRLHLDPVVHVHHAARLGHRRLHGIQLHFDVLHVVAVNFVVHFLHRRHNLVLLR